MQTKHLTLKNIPLLLLGKPARNVYLYVHGKMGSKEEALAFAELACPMGYQVLAIDLPEHGERKGRPEKLLPWVVLPELQLVYQYAKFHWRTVSLRATSIGAWLSMLALSEKELKQALFVSPVVDMENLIGKMMQWANVTEAQLEQAGEIPTNFGETLSWRYLCWDNMTSYDVIEAFRQESGAHLTIMEGGEHWFHTPVQMAAVQMWEEANL